MSKNLILKTSRSFSFWLIFFNNCGKIYAVIQVKKLILLYKRILRFLISDIHFYCLFNYLVTVMDIFETNYNYRAHNYFITLVIKFRNYFPSSSHKSLQIGLFGLLPLHKVILTLKEFVTLKESKWFSALVPIYQRDCNAFTKSSFIIHAISWGQWRISFAPMVPSLLYDLKFF